MDALERAAEPAFCASASDSMSRPPATAKQASANTLAQRGDAVPINVWA